MAYVVQGGSVGIRGLGLLAAAVLLACRCPGAERNADFNKEWRFALDPVGDPSRPEFDDAAWRSLDVPHDWVVENSCSSNLPFYQATGVIPGAGVGWYRKTFYVGDLEQCKVQVLFDGIYNNAETWINGHRLGFHPYGYTPFHYDLTPFLRADGENVLAVKVDHTRYADSRWYTGAGIYRNVQLVSTGLLHVPVWGIRITTPDVSAAAAKVVVETSIRNDFGSDRSAELRSAILDTEGRVVAESSYATNITAFALRPVRQEFAVPAPRLWAPGHPELYLLRSQVVADGRVVDETTTRFGIRSLRFDADHGFFLNGVNMKIKGVCLHHDGGLVGAAVPKGVWRRRLGLLREAGCNAIRTAHNPPSNEFLDLCDEMGLMVQDEFFDEWDNPKDKRFNKDEREAHYETQGNAEHFQEWAESDLKATVLSHRNHPSIIQWSIGNEIEWTYPRNKAATGFFDNMDWTGNYFWSEPPFAPEKIKAMLATLPRERYDIGETAHKLAGWTRELDTTRPVTANCILPSASHFSGYADALDVIGYSYRRILYDYGHRLLPDKPIMGTENVPQWHEWKAVEERDHIAGTFLWTGIQYMGEVRGDYPVKTNGGALLDTAGFKTPAWHMFRSLWSDEPHVALAVNPLEEVAYRGKPLYHVDGKGNVVPRDPQSWERMLWNWQDVSSHWNHRKGRMMLVEVYSNCAELQLLLNGANKGRKRLADFEDRIVKWAIPYEPGVLTVQGWKVSEEDSISRLKRGESDASAAASIATHGSPAAIAMGVDRRLLANDGYDVAHVEVQLVDGTGRPVRAEERELVFTVDPGLRVLGVDNGDSRNVQDFQSDRIVTHEGRALLVVQSTGTCGKFRVGVSGAGMQESWMQVDVGGRD